MSVTTHDVVVGVASLIAFPLALNIPAALASDDSSDGGAHPARVAAHVPR